MTTKTNSLAMENAELKAQLAIVTKELTRLMGRVEQLMTDRQQCKCGRFSGPGPLVTNAFYRKVPGK
jgi:hypothetical protein